MEGQTLPEVRDIMFENPGKWDKAVTYDWETIRADWHKHWDMDCPVLLEKGPPNMMRAQTIEAEFSNSHFIVLTRNPYVLVEGMMRRTSNPVQTAAANCRKYLEQLHYNLQVLERTVHVRYEDLVASPADIIMKVSNMIPEIGQIDFGRELYRAHNFTRKPQPIMDMNADKIDRLSWWQKRTIRRKFSGIEEVISSFGYDVI